MSFPPLVLAQVEAVHPNEFALSVVMPHLGTLSAVRVRVAADHATGTSGSFALPPQGAWGIVEFYQDDPRSGIWTHSVPDRRQHAAPLEILSEDPRAVVKYLPSGAQVLALSNGDHEIAFPDGTLFKLCSSGKNPKKATARKRSVRQGTGSVREDYAPPLTDPAHLHLHRPTGPTGAVDLDITPEGKLSVVLKERDKEMYRIEATDTGEITLRNLAKAKVQLGEKGNIEISTATGATVKIDTAGSVTINAAPGLPLKIQGAGAPVARVGSLVGPGPGGVLMVLTGNPLLQTAPA